jgi:hypothetical protein
MGNVSIDYENTGSYTTCYMARRAVFPVGSIFTTAAFIKILHLVE